MKGITAFALNNSRTVIMTIILVIVGGAYAFKALPKLEDPFIVIREAMVSAQYPGMPVEQIERLIVRPIEEKIRSMGEVDEIQNSTSKFGQCLIHVTIKDEVPSENLPQVWKLLRNKMHDVIPDLPEGTIGPMVDDTFGDTSVATIALWSDGFSMAEMNEVARQVREHLNLVEGIQKVDLTGVQDERIYIEVSNAKMTQLGINPKDIGSSLRAQNILLPAGKMASTMWKLSLKPWAASSPSRKSKRFSSRCPGAKPRFRCATSAPSGGHTWSRSKTRLTTMATRPLF